MELFTAETKTIINANSVTAKTYADKVGKAGFASYCKNTLGGVFARQYGNSTPVKTVQELHERMEFVAGLMSVFRFCYWNRKTWWFWLNSSSKAFYSSKVTNKGCRGGTIYQLCQGTDGRMRITCCNYGVDTLLKAAGIYSLKKTTVTSKSKLVPGDVIDLYKAGKWHHQIMVHSIESSKIWCIDFGNRFIKTGKPLHYMALSGSKAGGEYGSDTWKGRHRITLKNEKTEVVPTLNGIDIASYQTGINLSKVPGDFVIIKTTQGNYYKNPAAAAQIQSAKAAGKLLGLYHYAAGGDPETEADYFIASLGDNVKKAVLALDWERNQNGVFGMSGSVNWICRWMKRVHDKCGTWPLFYCQLSEVLARDWAPVAENCGLWLAQYVISESSSYRPTLQHGSLRAWGAPAIWQYTSGGHLTGWAGNLDLNVAYMTRQAWAKYADPEGGSSSAGDAWPVPRTVKNGSTGKVVRFLQAALGNLTIDGKAQSKTVAAIKAFQAKHGLKQDGVCGPVTWAAILSAYIKTVKKGSTGRAVRMLQAALGGLTIDGKAQSKTVAAIKAFQAKHGLKQDGVCGPVTWRVLLQSLA